MSAFVPPIACISACFPEGLCQHLSLPPLPTVWLSGCFCEGLCQHLSYRRLVSTFLSRGFVTSFIPQPVCLSSCFPEGQCQHLSPRRFVSAFVSTRVRVSICPPTVCHSRHGFRPPRSKQLSPPRFPPATFQVASSVTVFARHVPSSIRLHGSHSPRFGELPASRFPPTHPARPPTVYNLLDGEPNEIDIGDVDLKTFDIAVVDCSSD